MSEINNDNVSVLESSTNKNIELLISQIQCGPTFEDLLRVYSNRDVGKIQEIQENFTNQIYTLDKIIQENKENK